MDEHREKDIQFFKNVNILFKGIRLTYLNFDLKN